MAERDGQSRLERARAYGQAIGGPVIDIVGVLVVGWLVYSGRLTVLGGMPWLGLIYANKRPPGTVGGSAILGLLWFGLGRRGA